MITCLKDIARCFPKSRGIIAYGSAAFQQPGLYEGLSASHDAPMLDMIFAADNPLAWHRENMASNPDHYSLISTIHPSMMCSLCEVIGRGVHFNAYATVGQQDIKYGVISTSALLRDLWTWDNLFMAGRLHKPVLVLADDPFLDKAMGANLDSALAAALLLLPAQFSSQALMEAVCGLSYTGDIRMTWGEDRRKVQRIVQGSWPVLMTAFLPPLKAKIGEAAGISVKSRSLLMRDLKWDAMLEQTLGLPQTESLLSFLPQSLQTRLGKTHDRQCQTDAVSYRVATAMSLSEELHSVVKVSSVRQAMWGLASAGPQRSVRYAMAKARKGRERT